MDLGFEGSIAMVTGGNSGIGRSIALHLVEAGAEVVLIGRDVARGEATVKEIRGIGGRAEFFSLDVGDHDAVKALMEEVDRTHGSLNVIVNCAGGSDRNQGVTKSSPVMDRWNALSGGNFLGAYLVSTYGVDIMKRTGGAIVNISSTASQQGNYGLYGAMKAGLEGLTRGMAMEYAPHGIRVNAVAPGWIRTPAITLDPDESVQARFESTASLLGRVGIVDEIAAPTLFLASDRASFITGATLIVDGGLSIIDATAWPRGSRSG